MPSLIRHWGRLPSRIAMLLGLGALSVAATGARAGVAAPAHLGHDGVPIPQQSAKAMGDLLIWQQEGRIFVSEAGKPAEELHLGDTAEANLLRQLLNRENATAETPHVLRDRIILVGSGGSGLHWESQRPDEPNKAQAPTARNSGKPGSETAKAREQLSATQPPAGASSNSK